MNTLDLYKEDREEFSRWCDTQSTVVMPRPDECTGYDPYNNVGASVAREVNHNERNARQSWNSIKRLLCKASEISFFRRQA